MPLEEVEDMTWAEFKLRSYGFWEERKFQMYMTREVSHEVHKLNYMLVKTKPPTKEKFWPIDGHKANKKLSDEQVEAYKQAMEQYQKEING